MNTRIIVIAIMVFILAGCNASSASDSADLLQPLTDTQKASVRNCDIVNLAKNRYPEIIPAENLQTAYLFMTSDCDWAVLAAAYASRRGREQEISAEAKEAFSRATAHNYGFALTTELFYEYYDSVFLAPPPFSDNQEVANIEIQYEWGGWGEPVDYKIEIREANLSPKVSITSQTVQDIKTVDPDKQVVQSLGKALDNLLPIDEDFSLRVCSDNYPSWTVQITFIDSRIILLRTDSNLIRIGGPWFAEIDGQKYIQFSVGFIKAVYDLFQSLGLSFGEPMAWACGRVENIFDMAFPPK